MLIYSIRTRYALFRITQEMLAGIMAGGHVSI